MAIEDTDHPPCLGVHAEGVTLAVKVVPNAARTEPHGLWQDRLRIRLKAPPVDGKANKALCEWIAEAFGVRQQAVSLLQGEKSTTKLLLIRGPQLEEARCMMARWLEK